jgi:hypothetical protein
MLLLPETGCLKVSLLNKYVLVGTNGLIKSWSQSEIKKLKIVLKSNNSRDI